MNDSIVTALFCRRDSVYKRLPGVDAWDADRDALQWPGGSPVVAHPPCRAWGAFAMFAKPIEGEREYALWAVDQVRRWGGVLEHPARSALWTEKPLPAPGLRDAWGGWTLPVDQHSFGHRARKSTLLYICGVEPSDIPEMPLKLGAAEFVIGDSGRRSAGTKRPEISKAEREHTPIEFALWLVELARRSSVERMAAWQKCDCGEFWCNIHRAHAFECACPPIDEWTQSPYSEAT